MDFKRTRKTLESLLREMGLILNSALKGEISFAKEANDYYFGAHVLILIVMSFAPLIYGIRGLFYGFLVSCCVIAVMMALLYKPTETKRKSQKTTPDDHHTKYVMVSTVVLIVIEIFIIIFAEIIGFISALISG
ncbi:MAG: hypothetical protein WC180_05430 [Candidatus Paceibacterota bacterium]